MKEHRLKTHTKYFDRVLFGVKTFEVRLNDRDFQTGDTLILEDYDPDTKQYSGRELTYNIGYVLNGGQFGIEQGYCVLALTGSDLHPKS